MLLASAHDGLYRITSLLDDAEATVTRTHDASEPCRIHELTDAGGVLAASADGLFHSTSGANWRAVPAPLDCVLSVAEHPAKPRLYAGTDPSMLVVADLAEGVPTAADDWTEVAGFRELKADHDWGIPRHDGRSKIRSIRTDPAVPERIVVGIEVGGVFVSDDGGATWSDRRIRGFDAPYTDDIHHIELGETGTLIASTGSGLYISRDVGKSWQRLDEGHRQQYFRESVVHGDVIYAGGAPASSTSWNDDTDHALFECHDGRQLDRVDSPVEDEVVVGWGRCDGRVLGVTHRGALVIRDSDGWSVRGRIPHAADSLSRYAPVLHKPN